MVEEFWQLVNKIEDKNIREAVRYAINGIEEEYAIGFFNQCGGATKHHIERGGLARHTIGLTKMALAIADNYPHVQIDRDVLVAGCIFQDLGKINSYEDVNGSFFRHTEAGRLHHHIPMSFAIAREALVAMGVDKSKMDHILHIVVSHHGRREWGSNVSPATMEAFIGHMADYIDALIDGAHGGTWELQKS